MDPWQGKDVDPWAKAMAQDLVFSGSDFAAWDHPQGLVNVQADGIEVKRRAKADPYKRRKSEL